MASGKISKPKWTKGPWKQSGRLIYAPIAAANVCAVSEPHASKFVEYTELRLGSKDAVEAYANGELISAAPELYEALALAEALDFRDDCPECEGEGEPEACPLCFPKADEARLKRRAAMAKARGEATS